MGGGGGTEKREGERESVRGLKVTGILRSRPINFYSKRSTYIFPVQEMLAENIVAKTGPKNMKHNNNNNNNNTPTRVSNLPASHRGQQRRSHRVGIQKAID